MWIATILDYHALMTQIYPLYIASVGLLVVVLLIGKRVFGSTRWIPLPAGIHLQVSEFAKIAIILLVARFLTELRSDVLELRDLLKLAGVILLPMALIAKEPDLGTALTYLPILGIGIFLAGMKWKYWLTIAIVLLIVVPIGYTSLHAYQKARIVSFLDPERDPQGTDGLSADSVEDRGRRGWNVGQGRNEGEPDAVAVSAGSAHGFHFFGLRRGTRVHRRDGGAAALFHSADANCAEWPDGAGPGGYVRLHGCRSVAFISYTGECWNGSGTHAGDRHTAAAYELRGIEHLVHFSDAGSREQRAS
jgi:hypothetical protein